jgi:dihydrofolate reductase
MRKLVAGFACSVDGYIEGPHGEYDWIVVDKDMDFAEQAKRYDTFLFGRKSYEAVMRFGYQSSPGTSNYVFSNSLTSVHEPFSLIKGDIKEQVLHLKQENGKDIALYGGAGLLTSLLEMELVDEFTLNIIPVLLGKGKPMVEVLSRTVWLHYLKSHTYPNGTLEVSYAVNYNSGAQAGP